MPPPAIQMVNACGWWSRPRLRPSTGLDSTIGVRPNSPPHTTSVLSSSPFCLRSRTSAAEAWSVALVLFRTLPAAFDHAAREQARAGETRLVRGGPVEVEYLLRLLLQIGEFRRRGLKAPGHL